MIFSLAEATACIKALFAKQRCVYRLTGTLGVNRRVWDNPDALPHTSVADLFTGPIDPVTLFPTHPNNPSIQNVESDWLFNQADFPNNGTDQMEAWGWIDTRGLGPVQLREANRNTGEYGEAWIGECCSAPLLQAGFNDAATDATTSSDSGILDPTGQLNEGIHYVYMRMSDLSVFMGIQLQYSVNGTDWINFPAARSYATKPVVEELMISLCDSIPEGWSLKYINVAAKQAMPDLSTPAAGVPDDWRCEEVPVVLAYATVNQAGEVVARCGDFGITRIGIGTYEVVAPLGAEVAVPTVVEGPTTRDSIEIHMGTSFTGGTVHISEGDNGTAANIPRDRPWAITWYGKSKRVVCD
jgi:hypothetical protein